MLLGAHAMADSFLPDLVSKLDARAADGQVGQGSAELTGVGSAAFRVVLTVQLGRDASVPPCICTAAEVARWRCGCRRHVGAWRASTRT